ncbi:MAG: hypothetical protein QW336_00645 [Candidatus Anstonellales archaeon]
MICEICGKRKATRTIIIEGAEVEVCDSCGNADLIQSRSKVKTNRRKEKFVTHRLRDDTKTRIEDFMKSRGFDIRALSLYTKISERDLSNIMAGRLVDISIIRKLEKAIGKELLIEEVVSEIIEDESDTKSERVSLESFLKAEERDNGKRSQETD